MVVIFARLFIGWMERRLWLIEETKLVVFMQETQIGIGNKWRRKARREIDFPASIWAIKLYLAYLFHSWSASPHTPASLWDISCVQRGDKTHCLSASVARYIHLVPIDAQWAASYCTCGNDCLQACGYYCCCSPQPHHTVKSNIYKDRERKKEIIVSKRMPRACVHTVSFNQQQQKMI